MTDQTTTGPVVPGVGRVLGLLGLLLVVFLILDGFFAVLAQVGVALPVSVGLLIRLLLGWPLVLGLAGRSEVVPWREAFRVRVPRVGAMVAGLAVGLGLSLAILSLLTWLPGPPPESATAESARLQATARIPLLLALVVVAPLVEELFFRGWVLRAWQMRYGATRAVLGTALLFGVLHLLSWRVLVAAPLGLLLGWVVIRTGSVVPAIAGHLGANLAPRLIDSILAVGGYSPERIAALQQLPAWLPIGAVSVLVAGVLGVALGRRVEEPGEPRQAR